MRRLPVLTPDSFGVIAHETHLAIDLQVDGRIFQPLPLSDAAEAAEIVLPVAGLAIEIGDPILKIGFGRQAEESSCFFVVFQKNTLPAGEVYREGQAGTLPVFRCGKFHDLLEGRIHGWGLD